MGFTIFKWVCPASIQITKERWIYPSLTSVTSVTSVASVTSVTFVATVTAVAWGSGFIEFLEVI